MVASAVLCPLKLSKKVTLPDKGAVPVPPVGCVMVAVKTTFDPTSAEATLLVSVVVELPVTVDEALAL